MKEGQLAPAVGAAAVPGAEQEFNDLENLELPKNQIVIAQKKQVCCSMVKDLTNDTINDVGSIVSPCAVAFCFAINLLIPGLGTIALTCFITAIIDP